MRRKQIIIGYAVLLAALTGWGLPQSASVLPPAVVERLTDRLPAAITPLPMSGDIKILPSFSATRPFVDRRNAVMLGEEPFSLISIAKDGRSLEMAVPVKPDAGKYTNRWFRTEEVLGKVNWKPEEYTTACQHLLYLNRGKQAVELIGALEKDTWCVSLGTVVLGKVTYRLLQVHGDYEACGVANAARLFLAREAPPVKTQAEYNTRAAELLAEHAYRQGRPWGKMKPALLTKEGAFECAAMASDFARYMFGTGLYAGEKFTDPSEVRAGDIIHFKSHFIAVVFRGKGGQLHTIEGNMNSVVNQSKTYYSVKNGKIYAGGKPQEFDYGRHNWGGKVER